MATKENKDFSSSTLVEASQYGVLQRCIELVEQENVSVVEGDGEGITVLHWAAINNRIPVARYVNFYNCKIILSFIKYRCKSGLTLQPKIS